MTEDEEIKKITEAVLGMFAQMTGPTADLIRASGHARVDVLIDAYKKFQGLGMPDHVLVPVMTALAGGRSKLERDSA